jgi:outer membrane receptor for ferrienterochelin and colicin
MSVVLNASLIKSSVTVIDPLERDKNRPMQGQSPYIINTGLFYQNDSAQFSVTLLYNVIGPRIAFVGTVDDPHIYEMPRNLLDLSVSKKFGSHLSVKLGVKNLLNQRIVFQQEEAVYLSSSPTTLTKRIQETKSTIPGSQFNLGITYVF